ncbi:hypothetical protein AX14_013511 [Amanita brunnescens Koide BX004]|nr:hypothetical protein AX14_013511 [Amanita brunnescens Koide BX004]
MPSDLPVSSLALLFVLTLAFLFLRQKRQRHPYPPGPSPKPLIGNALDVPSDKPCIKYLNWSREFHSDIIHLTAMNVHIIILHKMKDVITLFEKRSVIFSDRPAIPAMKILGAEHLTPMLGYGNEWRKHRRFFQEGLNKNVMPSYAQIQTEKVHAMLDQLLRSPTKFREHCKWLGTAVVMATTFGYDFPPGQQRDRFVDLAEEISSGIAKLFLPGSTLINVLPFLRHIPPWLPGATTQKFAAGIRKSLNAYKNEPFEYVERELAAGTAKSSMLASILQSRVKIDGVYEDEVTLKDTVTTTYLAGVETLQSALTIIFFTMALHPVQQRQAQEEIDRVIGTERLPSFEDRASLPYVEAFLRETLRWRLVFPQGVAHTTITEDVYNGFYFPKGTLVIPNVWAITRDEDFYPDANSFRPERFFTADGSLNEDTMEYTLGFGRRYVVFIPGTRNSHLGLTCRICPGRYVADAVVRVRCRARKITGMSFHSCG